MNEFDPQWRMTFAGKLMYPNQVHIWRASIDLDEHQMGNMLAILANDEVERAAHFHFERDKKRFIAARGILRHILAGYLGKSPCDLKFEYSAKAKPALATTSESKDLSFNLSHSNGFALYAVTSHRNIGIDIEHINDDVLAWEIARKFFSKTEISLLKAIDKNEMHELFFQYWTRKEAILKARGDGISFPMEKVEVSSISGSNFSQITLPGDESESMHLYVQDLFPWPGYAAAIAVEGGDCDLSYLHIMYPPND